MERTELEERAGRRGGILTRADLDAAGLSAGGIELAAAAGRIVRVRRGVFTTQQVLRGLGQDQWGLHALQVRAALAMAGDTAVAAGASAAALHGLDMFGAPPRRPIITRPLEVSHNARPTGTTCGRVARLPDSHLTSLLGWPVTTVARTLTDIARRQEERCAVVAGDFALRAGLSRAELDAVLADCSRAPGIRAARDTLALCDGRAESPLESLVRLVLLNGGVPRPELQFAIGRYDVDFCWPLARLVLEADGRLKYLEAGDLFAEKRREDWIRAQGFGFLRTTWSETLQEPSELCRRVFRPLLAVAA